MLLQWFVLFDGLVGWKTQGEVWQGKVVAERNDGKGLDEESTRSLNISHINNNVRECFIKLCLPVCVFFLY